MSIFHKFIFSQERTGLHGKRFKLYKFKTMRDPKPRENAQETDAIRLTKMGSFLRKTSLDELPSIWNVIKGDMNLVGPRPLLPEYENLYTAEQNKRHLVKPGITGWDQVNGRNAISWEEKFRLDVWYVENRSFFLNLRILCLTVMKVLHCSDINAKGHKTMPPFTGTKTVEDKSVADSLK